MMKITVREFQRNASKYLDKLPIILTRYDKVVGVLDYASGLTSVKVEEKVPAPTPAKIVQKPKDKHFSKMLNKFV